MRAGEPPLDDIARPARIEADPLGSMELAVSIVKRAPRRARRADAESSCSLGRYRVAALAGQMPCRIDPMKVQNRMARRCHVRDTRRTASGATRLRASDVLR
ncbi:Hypothetical protein A7982_02626 [Minicystis rosea]|nr:Hypothetical protein A7982_02626 [Minicystis rosea]